MAGSAPGQRAVTDAFARRCRRRAPDDLRFPNSVVVAPRARSAARASRAYRAPAFRASSSGPRAAPRVIARSPQAPSPGSEKPLVSFLLRRSSPHSWHFLDALQRSQPSADSFAAPSPLTESRSPTQPSRSKAKAQASRRSRGRVASMSSRKSRSARIASRPSVEGVTPLQICRDCFQRQVLSLESAALELTADRANGRNRPRWSRS